ncbi:hypothetical protein AB0N73_10810 [Microbacterium sp. NPDC089189]|uniref:hypothetical protein n=1 Tax=Microbacterium sp. NPDC089189 TaxID=3154972 RepID=UPI0034230D79
MSRRLTVTTAVGAALLAVGLLTGCAGTGAPAPTDVEELELDAAWLDGGRSIAVTTWGSSGCIPIAEAAEVDAQGALTVTLVDRPNDGDTEQACTTDYVQRATVVGVPEGVDPAQELEITVTYGGAVGDTDLDGIAGQPGPGTPTEYTPSAGWVDDDGTFALLTWGSSTCAPVIEDVQAAGAEITVTFVTPPADRICTMDMAPRVTLGVVPQLDDAEAYELVLQGDTFTGTRVPVLG